MRAGISEIILPDLSLESFFAAASGAGYDVAELVIGGDMPLQLDNKAQMIPEILAFSKEYNLPVESLVQWQCTGNLLAGGESQRIGVEQTCEALEIGEKIGAKVSLHTLGALTPELYYEEAYENAVKSLKQIAPVAEKTGVALAVEFVWNGFLFSPLEMKRLLDDVGSEAVGFYFDPGNMAIFQYPHHWVRTLGKYIKAMHAKDWVGHVTDGGWKGITEGNVLDGRWTALLEGAVDYPLLMKELRAVGYDGVMINEVDLWLASLESTLQSMRKIMTM